MTMFQNLFQNMVGPGEVDDELEPEIKEECNTKYGDVQSVVIFEIPNTTPEESVRIFVEFKRVESAIKGNELANFFHKFNFSKKNFFGCSRGGSKRAIFRGSRGPCLILQC